VDVNEIKQLIELMNQHNLLEIEAVDKGKSIRLRRMYEGVRHQYVAGPMGGAMQVGAAPVGGAGGTAEAPVDPTLVTVKSPLVGTFYRSASPEAPSYVEIGASVSPDQTVCIIEAMKVFNEIKAEVAGEIVEICVENGQSVEFGQPIYRIRPK
jgi:acetyl-CoA carboxylase biotin carboxyl carrier protein